MSAGKVAVVTGGNKGIGLAIVRALCKQFNGDVYLTARDPTRGLEAVQLLTQEGLSPKFHQLDVTDELSIVTLRDFIVKNYGGLDVLVNNAAVSSLFWTELPCPKDFDLVMGTNYFAILTMGDVLFPILNSGARVVHLSSVCGSEFIKQCSDSVRQHLISLPSVERVSEEMKSLKIKLETGTSLKEGWTDTKLLKSYGISKAALALITPLQQVTLSTNTSKVDIVVNCCGPGSTSTDQSMFKGRLTPDEAADTPVYLALLPPNVTSPRGEFLYKRKVYDWRNGEYPDIKEVVGKDRLFHIKDGVAILEIIEQA